jgi:hypothetical protein
VPSSHVASARFDPRSSACHRPWLLDPNVPPASSSLHPDSCGGDNRALAGGGGPRSKASGDDGELRCTRLRGHDGGLKTRGRAEGTR